MATPAALPRSIYGSRAGRRRPLLASRLEKAAVVSFCLFYIFPPPFPMFSHRGLFQLNCYPVGRTCCLPQLSRQIIARSHHSPLPSYFEKAVVVSFWAGRRHPPTATCLHKTTAGSFPLLFIFLSLFHFFSRIFFELNCYSSCACRPPSVNKRSKDVPLLSPPKTRIFIFPHVFSPQPFSIFHP